MIVLFYNIDNQVDTITRKSKENNKLLLTIVLSTNSFIFNNKYDYSSNVSINI